MYGSYSIGTHFCLVTSKPPRGAMRNTDGFSKVSLYSNSRKQPSTDFCGQEQYLRIAKATCTWVWAKVWEIQKGTYVLADLSQREIQLCTHLCKRWEFTLRLLISLPLLLTMGSRYKGDCTDCSSCNATKTSNQCFILTSYSHPSSHSHSLHLGLWLCPQTPHLPL